jgi:hypothetical protein
MKLTYNDRNYASIPPSEWMFIANKSVELISDSVVTAIEEYEPHLRPTDAAIYYLEDKHGYRIANCYKSMFWSDWEILLFPNPHIDETLRINKLDMQVTKQFHQGMDYFNKGYSMPVEDSPLKDGWMAAREMDQIKKRYLQQCKETFVF